MLTNPNLGMFKSISRIHILFLLVISFICNNAIARQKSKPQKVRVSPPASLVVDLKTGKILHEQNANTRIHPASLTKLMTLYLTFESIQSGKLSLNKKLRVSERAENMQPSKLGLLRGEYITVKDAILATSIKSANDAAVTLSENIAKSEANFVAHMNLKARQLGMKDTKFKNASGWHHPEQTTTAKDLAKLAIALKRDFPRFYHIFSKTSFVYKGNVIKGHNHVTANYAYAEGLKTGYTRPSGFNLVTIASKDNKTLVGVVTGSPTAVSRDQKMVKLLDENFARYEKGPQEKKYAQALPNSYSKNKRKSL
jgi:D-alanyl-D-alanine carboxypeptidase (penicillin-binding protein 5/6)